MVRFLDGPADGQALDLRRAPVVLRVVRDRRTGAWDALDQLTDQPKPTEEIFVYRLAEEPTYMHLKCARRSQSGFRCMANYRHWPQQPADDQLRTDSAFNRWCLDNRAALMEGVTWKVQRPSPE